MHRGIGKGPIGDPPANYEMREIEPSRHEEMWRRVGSVRQAQYGQAPGFASPGASKWVLDRVGLDLTATALTIGGRVRVGSIQPATGEVELLRVQRAQQALSGTDASQIRVWLAKAAGVYSIKVGVYDDSAVAQLTLTETAGVTPGADLQWSVVTSAGLAATTTVTLNVGGNSQGPTAIPAGTYTITNCTAYLGHGTTPAGTYTVSDPINVFTSDVSGDGLADLTSRTPATSAAFQLSPTSVAPIGTGTSAVFPYPSPPLIQSGALLSSGLSGVLRVPFREVFAQFFTSVLTSVASREFTVKVRLTQNTQLQEQYLIDFPGLLVVKITAAGALKVTYGQEAEWTVPTLALTADVEETLWIGSDDTNLFVYLADGTNETTALVEANPPRLEYERIPDLLIGAQEDPALGGHFHGTISEFAWYAHPATSDDGVPIFELDLTGTEPRDKSKYSLPIVAEPHTSVDALPVLAPGPYQDALHAAVISGEVIVGAGTKDSTSSTYLSALDGSFTSAVSSARFGDKVFLSEPGGALAVVNTEKNQVRPLGLPQVQAEITARALGAGGLDGAYGYGVRFLTGDGTYGPVRRLKAVKALGGASVLLGASGGGAGASESLTELGESYGSAKSGYENHFLFGFDTLSGSPAFTAGAEPEKGLTVESYIQFPGFTDLEESVFDRGGKYDATGSKETAWLWNPGGIPLDFTEDFTLQAVFQPDTTFNATLANGDSQGIFAIGHNDPDPWTRPFMLVLYKDSAGWGAGSMRMVAFRCKGRRGEGQYVVAGFDDDGTGTNLTWDSTHEYNVTAVRRGDGLEVHVHDATDDDWFHYTTGTPTGGGSFTDLSTFFDEQKSFGHQGPATNIQFFTCAHKEEGGSGGSNAVAITKVTSTGSYDAAGARWIGAMSSASTLYHARAWSDSLSKAQIKFESEKRLAATAGEALDKDIQSDVAIMVDRVGETTNEYWDRAKGVPWEVYAEDSTSGKESRPKRGKMDYVDTENDTKIHGVYMTDSAENTRAECEYQLYASSIGEGAIVLSTGEESFVMVSKPWKEGAQGVTVLEGFDPENFNWYTTSVVFYSETTEWDLSIRDLAVNGVDKNAYALSGPAVATLDKATFRVYLGGFTGTTNGGEARIGEFRLWSTNRYDTGNYDFLFSRVTTSAELATLQIYATFQPADENATINNKMDDRGTLAKADRWTKFDGLTDGWAEGGVDDAEIIDGREGSGGIENPPPAVQFPDAPYPHITAIQLLRTGGQPVLDPEDKEEIARALLAADGAPLRELARIPIGRNSYIDVQPDAGLGAEVQEGTGFVPARVKGAFTWANRVGLFRDGVLQLSDPGAFGWESFGADGQIVVSNNGTSDITAVRQFAGALAVFGEDWCTLIAGQFENYKEFYLGACGAQSARAITTYGGALFSLSANTLWRISPPSGLSAPDAEDFGIPVQDLLPAQGRLCVSSSKASLYVIDEATGQCLRFHFPTQRWFIEHRDALSVGDTEDGFTVVHTLGSYSEENTAVAGDDVNAGTSAVSVATKATASTLNLSTDPNAPVGTRVLIVDEQDNAVLTRVVSYT